MALTQLIVRVSNSDEKIAERLGLIEKPEEAIHEVDIKLFAAFGHSVAQLI
tara:strand:+ start:596 stop:748 length:153 start_codon:yes stop_codon:yes gene_type:complete